MSEWLLLGLVASGLYLFECLAWIAATAVVCVRAPLRRRWSCASGASLPGSERGGLVLSDPFTIGGTLVVCRHWPLALDPDGVAGPVAFADSIAAPGPIRYRSFDTITSVEAVLDEIHINGERFVRLDSSAAAVDLAERLRRLGGMGRSSRAAEIRATLRDTLDHRAAARSWDRFGLTTASLRWRATVLAAFTFVAAPLVLALFGPYPSWIYLLAGLIAATLATVIAYVRAHAVLYRHCTYDRWVHALSMLLLPVAAIRGVDRLSRDALGAYGPAVVLPALCGREASIPVLRQLYVDLQQARAADGAAETIVSVYTWFRELLITETAAAFERQGLDVLRPPARQPAMAVYCRRCHAQFGSGGARACPDCGVELATFGT